MDKEYERLLEKSRDQKDFIARQMKYLGKFNIKNFDHVVADFHEEIFAQIDCRKCGNCCRMVGPKMNEPDIKRVCKAIGIDQKHFVEEKLVHTEDMGWMFRETPCMFLNGDNSCSVYEKRPNDCEDFPYTRERAIQRSLGRLAFDAEFCPAAYLIALKIIERYAPGITKY